jgi:hypothetical protein
MENGAISRSSPGISAASQRFSFLRVILTEFSSVSGGTGGTPAVANTGIASADSDFAFLRQTIFINNFCHFLTLNFESTA